MKLLLYKFDEAKRHKSITDKMLFVVTLKTKAMLFCSVTVWFAEVFVLEFAYIFALLWDDLT